MRSPPVEGSARRTMNCSRWPGVAALHAARLVVDLDDGALAEAEGVTGLQAIGFGERPSWVPSFLGFRSHLALPKCMVGSNDLMRLCRGELLP